MVQHILFPQPTGERLTGAVVGQQLLSSTDDRFQREDTIDRWVDEGLVPSFMADFVTVEAPVPNDTRTLFIFVAPEVLCLGTDDDYVRVPLFPTTAQRIADRLGCILPTPKISDLIWKNAAVRVKPSPWGPPYDASMMSSYRIVEHNRRCGLGVLTARPDYVPGMLVAGHKKDIVVCHEMKQDHSHVWIYGWHQLDGKPIQGLYGGHETRYADYAHSVRLVLRWGNLREPSGVETTVDLVDIFADPKLSKAIDACGSLVSWRYAV